MAAINSLLFVLSTLAPFTELPQDTTVTYSPAYDWNLESSTELIHSNEAEICAPEEEYLKCGTACPLNCTNYDKDITCSMPCIEGCFCKKPFIRGPEGKCIHPNQCSATEKKDLEDILGEKRQEIVQHKGFKTIHEAFYKHPSFFCKGGERFSLCSSLCPDTCQNYENPRRPCNLACIPGCKCEDGYVKGDDGNCIKPEQCQKRTCPRNEIYLGCGTSCPKNCSNYDESITFCTMDCVPGCFCKYPMVRGPDGKCVLPDECLNESKRCPLNEEYQTCGTSCPKRCTSYDKDALCEESCNEGCFCKEPLVRGPHGECIFSDECPNARQSEHESNLPHCKIEGNHFICKYPTCKDNEKFSWCMSFCPDTCENYKNPYRPCNMMCLPGCTCIDGYVKGADGICIKKEECETFSDTCPENEEYRSCGTSCPQNCTNYDKAVPCLSMCIPGCYCEEPMIRGLDGRCIFKEQCPKELQNEITHHRTHPKLFCKANEEFSLCSSVCPDTCENHQNSNRFCKHICVPGCKCVDGYVKGNDGVCIRPEQCRDQRPEDCSSFEFFDLCGSYCETDCNSYNIQDLQCEDKRCKKGCVCKPGFVRALNWECVSPYDCPASPTTQAHSSRSNQRDHSQSG